MPRLFIFHLQIFLWNCRLFMVYGTWILFAIVDKSSKVSACRCQGRIDVTNTTPSRYYFLKAFLFNSSLVAFARICCVEMSKHIILLICNYYIGGNNKWFVLCLSSSINSCLCMLHASILCDGTHWTSTVWLAVQWLRILLSFAFIVCDINWVRWCRLSFEFQPRMIIHKLSYIKRAIAVGIHSYSPHIPNNLPRIKAYLVRLSFITAQPSVSYNI